MKKKSRKLKRNIRNFFILTILVVVSTYIGWFLQRKENLKNIKVNIEYKTVNTKKEYKTNLVMVGDALIHGTVYQTANRYAGYTGYDFKPMLEEMKPIIIENQDVTVKGIVIGVLRKYRHF